MTNTGRAGQPGLLAERPHVGDTNNSSWWSSKCCYFLISAQIQSGCCALGCCGQAFPKHRVAWGNARVPGHWLELGTHQARSAPGHRRNQTQALQDLHTHTDACVTTGSNWRREKWGQLDCNFECRHFSLQAPKSCTELSPRFQGQQLHYAFFLRVSALQLLRAGTFIIYRTAGLFIIEENQALLLIH